MITALEPLGRDALAGDAFTALVRTITGDPAATPGDVRVEPVDYPIGTPSTAALLRLFGTATTTAGDAVGWSCFVKKFQSPRHWAYIDMVPEQFRAAFIQNLPWQLEIAVHRSGIADVLPDGMRLPQAYRIDVYDDDRGTLWMENIVQEPGPWPMERFERAAYLLGLLSARRQPHLVEPLSDFVRRLKIPFFNTQMGKGAVTGGSNLYLGTAALSERDYIHAAIKRADLVIAIGHDTVEKPPFLMGGITGGPKVIHIGYQPAHVEQVFYPDAELIGDIGANVTALADRLAGQVKVDPKMLDLRKNILEHLNEGGENPAFPVLPQRIVRDVRKAMPDDGIVCLDNGMYKIWFARGYRTHVANTLLLDNALATMGAGLPSAIAAKVLYPHRRVMAVCGDGGFMMNSQELETAVRLGLDLVVLIIEDSAYGMIRWKQAVDGFPDFGMDFSNPDFELYAKAYGAQGHRVRSTEAFLPTLQAALDAGGVHLITVPVDYRENTRVFIEELGNLPKDIES